MRFTPKGAKNNCTTRSTSFGITLNCQQGQGDSSKNSYTAATSSGPARMELPYDREAVVALALRAEKGDADAQYELGGYYLVCHSPEKDGSEFMKRVARAVEEGFGGETEFDPDNCPPEYWNILAEKWFTHT